MNTKIRINFFSVSILSILIVGNALCQNLVLNPGFEDLTNNNWVISENVGKVVKYWKSPTKATPNAFYADNYDSFFKQNSEGGVENKQKRTFLKMKSFLAPISPKEGKVMIGLQTYCNSRCKTKGYREYIQGEFIRPLSNGNRYTVEMWVTSHPEWKFISKNISIWLTKKDINSSISTLLTVELNVYDFKFPEIDRMELEDRLSKGEWVKATLSFEAKDNFTHFIIGNFKKDLNLLKQNKGDKIDSGVYFFIDDILIKKREPRNLPTKVIFSDNIQFKHDDSNLDEESKAKLGELIKKLDQVEFTSIHIIGHTDDIGNEKYNVALSKKRAETVSNFLVNNGLSQKKIKYTGVGSSTPPINSEKNRRRVSITVR